jgi:hypothetical protein
MARYQGVDVDHPTIVAAIKAMAKQGDSTEKISQVVGMPYEVVKKYEREARREK